MFKLTEKTRLALKFSQEIRTEMRISNINLKKTEKPDLRWNFPKRSERKRVFLILI